MRFLFVHNNFPAQFRHIAGHLARDPRHVVHAIGAAGARDLPGVDLHRYSLQVISAEPCHPFARSFDLECRRAEQVLYVASALASTFTPDVIVVHSAWGEAMPLRAIFPGARIITYCEFYYRASGQDVDFDPEFGSIGLDGITALSARNATGLLALAEADNGLSPTQWQKSTYPKALRDKIEVIHEGIDTRVARPDRDARFHLPDGRTLKPGDPVVTFVSRDLEPLRGYHVFMRALPLLMRRAPEAQIIVVGGNGCSYGAHPPPGHSWKDIFLREVEGRLDARRLCFLDRLSYDRFLNLLQVSAAHVYFTYPFVLSWSLIEAMSCGCAIVASDTAPVHEVLDDESAALISFLDSKRLADAVVAVLRDPGRAASRRLKARARAVDEFDLVTRTLPAQERFLLGAR